MISNLHDLIFGTHEDANLKSFKVALHAYLFNLIPTVFLTPVQHFDPETCAALNCCTSESNPRCHSPADTQQATEKQVATTLRSDRIIG